MPSLTCVNYSYKAKILIIRFFQRCPYCFARCDRKHRP